MKTRLSDGSQGLHSYATNRPEKHKRQPHSAFAPKLFSTDVGPVKHRPKASQLKFQGDAQPHGNFLDQLVKRVLQFLVNIVQAFSELLGMPKQQSDVSVQTQAINHRLEQIANNPELHTAMEETGRKLEQVTPNLGLLPDQQAFLQEQATLLKTPQGRKSIIRAPFLEALQSGKATKQYFLWLAELNRELDGKNGAKVVELLAPDADGQDDGIDLGYEADDEPDGPEQGGDEQLDHPLPPASALQEDSVVPVSSQAQPNDSQLS